MRLGKSAHRIELMTLNIQQRPGGLLFQAAAQPGHIGRIVKQHRLGRQAITPGAARLLIVGFDIARNVEMHHKAHVRFVDAHTKGDGRHHNLQIVALELLLHLGTDVVFQPGMVSRRAKTPTLQTGGGVFHFCPAVTVDNARLAALLLHVAQELIQRLKLFHQHVANVRAIEAADLNQRIVEPQQARDIKTGGVIGGGGERHKRHGREALTQLAEGGIFRAEIMSPLGNTVGFVHRHQHRIPVRQMLKKVIQHQTFRRDIQQADLPATATGHHLLLLLSGLRRVQTGRRHAVGQQLVHLIFHQRDQGRYHDGQAIQYQRRHLIA
ncbi:hypothetical protein D3C75_466380 [compost metagenome]